MDKLTNALHMMGMNLSKLKERRASIDYIRGYERAIKDITWLKGKVDQQEEKNIEEYFNIDQRTAKLKRISQKYGR